MLTRHISNRKVKDRLLLVAGSRPHPLRQPRSSCRSQPGSVAEAVSREIYLSVAAVKMPSLQAITISSFKQDAQYKYECRFSVCRCLSAMMVSYTLNTLREPLFQLEHQLPRVGSKIWKYLEDDRDCPGQTAKLSMTSRGYWYPKKKSYYGEDD